ncbi:hypothetical protein CW745_13900 [Psychromonas sp. psych-6C06]|uniref:head-tail joining protein n=1 Tax=Psychromonas sp. psych-6C06 TaxID=2058089 RepID=UPI000C32536B|nr:hypothetical protein [Psychromonas sp. psych-6C06]PKF60620.1 hypothetical protein CW745_13900 [Psychromonas sp. psych-6C06]
MPSLSERFALKEWRALQKMGDPAIYNANGTGPDINTSVIVDVDTELETELGTETTSVLILSSLDLPDHARGDEITIKATTYRLNRKIKTEGTLISYSAIDI